MLALGLGTAFCAVTLYALVAYCTVRIESRLRSTLDVLTWLPLTIPGIILAFGYLNMALRVPIFAILYGTIGALILVSFLSAMTLGVQVLKVHMLQIGAEVEEAGRVVGGSWTQTYHAHPDAAGGAGARRGRRHGVRGHDPQRLQHHYSCPPATTAYCRCCKSRCCRRAYWARRR